MLDSNTSRPQTLTEKLFTLARDGQPVHAGTFIEVSPDVVLGNDITTPVAMDVMKENGCYQVAVPDKVVIVPDHFTPNKDIASAEQAKRVRQFVNDQKIDKYFEVGTMGIEHCLLPEQGLVTAGDIIIGADSHTCTYGALGAFATGVGSTDMAAAMVDGLCWFRVPETIRVELQGRPQPYVSGKDIILHLIGLLGVDGAMYKALEFGGQGLRHLSMDDRFTMANMAVEAGAKNGVFEVDATTCDYLEGRSQRLPRCLYPDQGAVYSQVITLDLGDIPLTLACPSLPSNTKPIDQVGKVKVDQVVIGSCTNGRLSDLKAAAEVLQGKKVAPNTRVIIIPGTQQIYLEAIEAGYVQTFIKAGALVSTPTCGPCLGGHMGVLADGEVALATTNRNFVGRMGHVGSKVYLASPVVAAATAIAGFISSPSSPKEVDHG